MTSPNVQAVIDAVQDLAASDLATLQAAQSQLLTAQAQLSDVTAQLTAAEADDSAQKALVVQLQAQLSVLQGAATVYATPENTGAILPDSTRKNYAGTLNVKSGDKIRDLTVTGPIRVAGGVTDVLISNVKDVGSPMTTTGESSNGLIQVFSAGSRRVQVWYTDLIPAFPSQEWDGVLGHDIALHYVKIMHVADGIGVQNVGEKTQDRALELDHVLVDHLAFWGKVKSSSNPPQSHNDCVQDLGGPGFRWIHNGTVLNAYKSMPDGMGHDDPLGYVGDGSTQSPLGGTNVGWPYPQANAAIMLNTSQGASGDWLIEDSRLGGGQTTLNLAGAFNSFVMRRVIFDGNPSPKVRADILGGARADIDLATVHRADGSPLIWKK
jgi:hypothetical protein